MYTHQSEWSSRLVSCLSSRWLLFTLDSHLLCVRPLRGRPPTPLTVRSFFPGSAALYPAVKPALFCSQERWGIAGRLYSSVK